MQKINFKLPDGRVVKLNVVRKPKVHFVAKCPTSLLLFGIGNITVDELFLRFKPKERVSIIFHELWHKDNHVKFELSILFSKKFWHFFWGNKLGQMQEFEADKFSAMMAGKKNTISGLTILKKLIVKGVLKEHEKTHPPIDERIKRIKEIKSNRRIS